MKTFTLGALLFAFPAFATTVTVEVSEALKGEGAQATVDIVQPGGVVGDIGQKVAGTASFKVGDQVVTFVERRGSNGHQLVGMAQGCFHVEPSSDGNAAFVVPDSAELLAFDPVTHAPVARGAAPMKLDELKSQVRAALAPGVAQEPQPKTGPILRESVK